MSATPSEMERDAERGFAERMAILDRWNELDRLKRRAMRGDPEAARLLRVLLPSY